MRRISHKVANAKSKQRTVVHYKVSFTMRYTGKGITKWWQNDNLTR